ncbi:hypothetical protein [Aeromonas sp. ASNIH5]|uniref:hypothetical protein n=1 Tax=Aeromonas sp. ASNIH5 TaxID=1758179 RepID=UPI00131564CC|nr:hypothetical protein [Aeromonas sp. ASNIH5]
MFDLCFCVVLYKKQPVESETISSLIGHLPILKTNSIVVVFNNGPEISKNDNLPDFITIHQVLINGSLSKIYNKTLELYRANKYVFLDDDTNVTESYLFDILKVDFKVLMPKIKCQGMEYYPTVTSSGVQTITSGLAISNFAIQEIKDINGCVFDESFELYGIDTAFCYFLNKERYQYTISNAYLEHQLSHVNDSSGEFRKKEVLLANAAALIKYFNVKLIFQVGSSVLWAIKEVQIKLLYKVFLSFISCKVIR